MLLQPAKARSIIEGYERTINDSLMELASRSVWFSGRYILANLLEEIADMRFGDPPLPRPHGFYSGPLYWDVFGPDPVGNVGYRMRRLVSRSRLIGRHYDAATMAETLRKFHNNFAYGCEEGKMDAIAVTQLLREFEQGCTRAC